MEITVLQWNIWYKEDIQNIAKFLNENKPDIICLQELTINSKDQTIKDTPAYIAEQLGYNYYFKELPIESTDGESLMIANGIFSKYPISKSRFVWTTNPNRPSGYNYELRVYVEVTLKIDNKEVIVGTTHMSFTHRFEGTPNKDNETAHLLKELERHQDSYVFTGDLNALPGSNTIKSIEELLVNAGPDLKLKTWTTKPFSYNGFEANTLDWRLDYVFKTKDIKVLSSEILNTQFSDHLPILTKINI